MAKDNREEIRPYVADMAAVERHILEALERQHKDDTFKDYPNALGLVGRLAGVMKTHGEGLEAHLSTLPGGGVANTVKETVAGVLGGLAGIYDKVRKDKVSRALRDDYTALSLAVVSYTMLHSTALGLHQGMTADLALRNLKELTPFLVELSQIIPQIVLKELSFEGYDIDASLAPQAVRATQEAWSSENTREGAPAGTGLGRSFPG